ncbi:Ig-like domain-containing protein, partial [Alcanivoracaceae bacterium MT1]
MNIDVVSLDLSSSKASPMDAPVTLDVPSIVKIPLAPSQVAGYTNSRNNLIIDLVDGRQIIIQNFFVVHDGKQSELVLEDQDGTLWWGHYDAAASQFNFEEIGALTEVVGGSDGGHGAALLLAALGAGALAHELSKGGGGPPKRNENEQDDPSRLSLSDVYYEDGAVKGKGNAGSSVQVKDAEGNVIGEGTVGEDGKFSVPVEDTNGGTGEVTLTDDAGNTSDPADVTLPDTLAPEAPTDLAVDDNGTLTGKGEAGTRVEVKDPEGKVIGEGTVNEDGTFEIPLKDTQGGTGEV